MNYRAEKTIIFCFHVCVEQSISAEVLKCENQNCDLSKWMKGWRRNTKARKNSYSEKRSTEYLSSLNNNK